jgi:hypothetical protein
MTPSDQLFLDALRVNEAAMYGRIRALSNGDDDLAEEFAKLGEASMRLVAKLRGRVDVVRIAAGAGEREVVS